MKKNSRLLSKLIAALFFISMYTFAGANRGGYISYTHTSGFSYHFKIITLTNSVASQSDRCTETLMIWQNNAGPAIYIQCYRTNFTPGINLTTLNPMLANCPTNSDTGQGLIIQYPYAHGCNGINYLDYGVKYNVYEGDFTFAGAGTYIIGMVEPSLDGYANNIAAGSSSNVAFALADTLNISSTLFYNNSPVASNFMVDSVCIGNIFNYNINLTDADNDSLSYTIIPYITGDTTNTSFYAVPASYIPNGMTVDATGNINWQTIVNNCNFGEYDVDILVKEYRRIGGIVTQIGSEVFAVQLNAVCCNASAIKNTNHTEHPLIYPNPAGNKITIDATNVIELKLFDVIGNQITSTKENYVDVSTLTNGVYFIQVQTNTGTSTHKVIVQH